MYIFSFHLFQGIETFEECFKECQKVDACTGFDLTPTEVRDRFRCYLFGHNEIIPATSTSFLASNCYKMAGRQTIPGAKAPVPKKKSAKAKAEAKEAKKAKKPSTPKGTGKIDILCVGVLHLEAICSKRYLLF